jgi:hypothetical protein
LQLLQLLQLSNSSCCWSGVKRRLLEGVKTCLENN